MAFLVGPERRHTYPMIAWNLARKICIPSDFAAVHAAHPAERTTRSNVEKNLSTTPYTHILNRPGFRPSAAAYLPQQRTGQHSDAQQTV